jgi:hypothetical protein
MLSNPYLFGCKAGKLTADAVKRHEAAAVKHDVDFYHAAMPGEGWKSWFAGPNLGEPFDRHLAADVMSELR